MIKRYSELKEVTRSRPSERILFNPPITGPSGAQLTNYEWKYMWSLKEDDIEGEVEVRVSDWDNAEPSDETGRLIVHQFGVKDAEGNFHVVSAETLPVALGLVTPEQKKTVKGLGSAAKTLARLKVQKLRLDTAKEQYAKDKEKVESLPLPEMTTEEFDPKTTPAEMMKKEPLYLRMGDAKVLEYRKQGSFLQETHEDRVRILKRTWYDNRLRELGWTSATIPDKYKEASLLDKIQKQEKKLNALSKNTKL